MKLKLVWVNQTHSLSWTTNRGAPQGCISTPLLYTFYKNDCTSTTTGNFIVRFADDSAILSLLFAHSNIDTYFFKVNRFTEWCTDNFLEHPKTLKKLYLITNNNNNNEYLEHLTCTGPKHLHVLYKHILSKFNAYNMNTCTHKSVCVHLPVVISDQTIEQVRSYKYLGIHIDSKLSWIVHVEAVCFSAH